ncbi:MAG: PIN domain-containing protein [Promethearchaeota archaeon]
MKFIHYDTDLILKLNPNLKIVIIDSNFILLPFQFKIDYFNEIRSILEGSLRFIIFQQILNELESKKRRESNSINFSILLESGLLYVENNRSKYDIQVLDDVKNKNETTDAFLLKKLLDFKDQGNIVFLATNDSALRKKAKINHISTIFLRQKKYLSIERT